VMDLSSMDLKFTSVSEAKTPQVTIPIGFTGQTRQEGAGPCWQRSMEETTWLSTL